MLRSALPELWTVMTLGALAVSTRWVPKAWLPGTKVSFGAAGPAGGETLPCSVHAVLMTPPAGRPSPSTLKKFVSNGLPMTACATLGSPMKPSGGPPAADGCGKVSHVRKGPRRLAIASPKAQTAGKSGAQPMSSVPSLLATPPSAPATKVSVPKGWVTVYVAPGTSAPAPAEKRIRENVISSQAPGRQPSGAPPAKAASRPRRRSSVAAGASGEGIGSASASQ